MIARRFSKEPPTLLPLPAVSSSRTRVGPSTCSRDSATPRALRSRPASSSWSVALPGWVTRKSSDSRQHRSSSAWKERCDIRHRRRSGEDRLIR